MHPVDEALIQRAAEAIAQANALVVAAGAGMGVDSGLPDFRGNQGFWQAYPPYQKLGLDFIALANPAWFRRDPAVAWGFYGHRRNLYRATQSHAGFHILQAWAQRMEYGAAVFTSNVDGHFQRAGFAAERVVEIHGAVDFNQCTQHCGVGIYPAEAEPVAIDEATMRAMEPLPKCPQCGALARPNILMFGDYDWAETRTAEQTARFENWLSGMKSMRLVVVECGAGTAIPTVRLFSERLVRSAGGTLIRLNVREPEVPDGQIGLALGALAGVQAIDQRLRGGQS
ncbi:MAG: NAD-dependent protein deacetylase [Planctomycetia bacterium]|nr:NAD-dependent protein deacetylase [Planctomycetia bacterium]